MSDAPIVQDQAAERSAGELSAATQAVQTRQVARTRKHFKARMASRLVFPSAARRARYVRAASEWRAWVGTMR